MPCHGRSDQRIQLDADAFPDRVSIRLHHLGDSFDPPLSPRRRWTARGNQGFAQCLPHRKRGRRPVFSRRTWKKQCGARQKRSEFQDARDSAMQLTFEKIGDVAVSVVPVEGELDASNAGVQARDRVIAGRKRQARARSDPSMRNFVDSSGLGAFISCLRKLNAREATSSCAPCRSRCERCSSLCGCIESSTSYPPRKTPCAPSRVYDVSHGRSR